MSNMVKFGNPGNINPKVWSVFGVSAKLNDDSIGRFGTGLKYAIAVLLREDREIRIKSNGEVYEFSTKQIEERGKVFHQVLCNGEELPFTTHLGDRWELWQAYRELYSNCVDEGGYLDYKQSETETALMGYTVVEAQIGDIDHNSVFLDTKHLTCLSSDDSCNIYNGNSEWIYYKGIRAHKLNKPSMFTYNILKADLTEDRTFKYMFQIDHAIATNVFHSKNKDFVFKFLFGTKDFFEEVVRFEYANAHPSPIAMTLVSEKLRDSVWMHPDMRDKVRHYLPDEGFITIDPDERQTMIIQRALSFCEKIGHKVDYPVHVSDDLGNGVLAVAEPKTDSVYLSPRVMTMGLKQVVSTLVEENMHLKYGLGDCNYETQNWLFDQIVTMGEKLTGEIL